MISEPNLKDAICQVLTERLLHYAAIADAIKERNVKEKMGATPAATVNATVSYAIQTEGEKSPFRRIGRGIY